MRNRVKIKNMNEKTPEEMAAFFDLRADGYDAHMEKNLVEAEHYYQTLAAPLPQTNTPLHILDLGCGTGLEIPAIIEKAPNAHLTCIDLSVEMLTQLQNKFPDHANLKLIQESYLEADLGEAQFDIILSSMTLHHLLPESKLGLYQKICCALRPGGIYIEGDYIVSPEKMSRLLSGFQAQPEDHKNGSHHIDLPLSLEKQTTLLAQAGLANITVIYHQGENVILSAQRPGETRADAAF